MKSVKVSLNRAKRLVKQADELVKSIEENVSTNALKIEDIYLPLNHLFNMASKRAFENKVTQSVIQRESKLASVTKNKVIDQVRFFGAKAVGERKIFDAAQKVANQINFYADRGWVTGVMAKLTMLQLATEPHQLETYCIMSYVALSPEGLEYVNTNPTNLEFPIGSLPLNSDDL